MSTTSPNTHTRSLRRRATTVLGAVLVVAALGSGPATAQENIGDNGPEDTFFTFRFTGDRDLARSMPVETSTVAGPQSPDADLLPSPSVYAVTLSYGIESPAGRLRTVVAVTSGVGESGASRTLRAKLTSRQVAALRSAARRARKRSVFVVVDGIARRVNGGEPGRIRTGTRLGL